MTCRMASHRIVGVIAAFERKQHSRHVSTTTRVGTSTIAPQSHDPATHIATYNLHNTHTASLCRKKRGETFLIPSQLRSVCDKQKCYRPAAAQFLHTSAVSAGKIYIVKYAHVSLYSNCVAGRLRRARVRRKKPAAAARTRNLLEPLAACCRRRRRWRLIGLLVMKRSRVPVGRVS